MRKVLFKDLGLIDYKVAWDLQEQMLAEKVAIKMQNRNLAPEAQQLPDHHLLFCEHPHVYTLGKSGSAENLLVNEEQLAALQASYYKINRGGDITYHGPGQLVAYPLFDLEQFYTDIHRYLRNLEEAVILTLGHYGIKAGRIDGLTGVWLDMDDHSKARKICAMGVRCSRWVTMHGLALNVNSNLEYFNHIVPCGIQDKAVTSLQKELGHEVNMAELKQLLCQQLSAVFELQLVA